MFTVGATVEWERIEEQVRQVTLLHPRDGEVVFPYADANIRLEEVSYDKVLPTTLYVIRDNLAVQTAINSSLSQCGYDSLELEGGLVLGTPNGDIMGLVPPIVEETEADGQYILDGAHRSVIGLWAGRTSFVAILISDIRPDCPSYALPNNWNEIKIVEDTPKDLTQKKKYRTDDYYSLYRNLAPLTGGGIREAKS